MKRSLIWFLTVAVALSCCLGMAFSANAETEGLYTYTVSNGKATITACNTSASGAVTIPSTLGGYPVVALGTNAFQACGKITSVVIPEGVQTIGDRAFYYCGMSTVTIPNTVTSIGDSAFSWSVNLTSIQIPASVQSIGFDVFSGSGQLTGIHVDPANTAYSSDANGVLFNKDKTTLIRAAQKLSGSYSIPAGVQIIDKYAFKDCDGMTAVTIPEGVQRIEVYAFSDCDSLTSVTIPDSVQTIGANGFYYCDSLEKLVVGNGVKTIGEFCFTGCKKLTSAKLGSSLEKLEMCAFSVCTSLTDVVLPESIQLICWAAFNECPALKTYGNARYLGTASNPYYALVETVDQLIKSCRVHEDTVMIANGSFRYVNLTALELGASVKVINKDAFVGCSYMKDVYYTGTEAQFGQISIGSANYDLTRANIHYATSMPVQKGDLDNNDVVSVDDAIYLLQHVLMPDLFLVEQDVNYDKTGDVTVDDAIYLLQHVLMPNLFPL